MRSDPEAALQASEIVPSQGLPENTAEFPLRLWQIKRDRPPFPIPRGIPQPSGIDAAKRQKPSTLGQLHHTIHRSPAAFQAPLLLQPPHPIQQPSAPSPPFKRLVHRTKCRPRHDIQPPNQRIKKKFRPRFHSQKKTTLNPFPQTFWPIGQKSCGRRVMGWRAGGLRVWRAYWSGRRGCR